MKFGHYYVVEVSFFEGNPVHRQICECWNRDNAVKFLSTGDQQIVWDVSKLPHFDIVSEIKEMYNYRNV